MSTTTGLSSLPGELLQQIIGHYAATVNVIEVWGTRGVSKLLEDAIKYYVVNYIPIIQFGDPPMTATERKQSVAILGQNLAAILQSPVRRASNQKGTTYIPKKVGAIMAADPSAIGDDLETQYVANISLYLTSTVNKRMIGSMLSTTADCYRGNACNDCHGCSLRNIFAPINKSYQELADEYALLTGKTIEEYTEIFGEPEEDWKPTALNLEAAAAVGSIPAMKHFLEELGPNFLTWMRRRPDEDYDPSLLNCPFAAAASTGQLESIRFLLPRLKDVVADMITHYRNAKLAYEEDNEHNVYAFDYEAYVKTRVHEAIYVAIKSKQIAITHVLCNFANAQGWKVTLPVAIAWLKSVAKTGCFYTGRAVLIALSQLCTVSLSRQHWVTRLFIWACESGATDTVRIMLARNMVDIRSTPLVQDKPGCYVATILLLHVLRLAAAQGHADTVYVLIPEDGTGAEDVAMWAMQHGRARLMWRLLQRPRCVSCKFLEALQHALQSSVFRYVDLGAPEIRYHVPFYYIAAKFAVREWPERVEYMERVKGLITDVEDSAIWREAARRIMGMEM